MKLAKFGSCGTLFRTLELEAMPDNTCPQHTNNLAACLRRSDCVEHGEVFAVHGQLLLSNLLLIILNHEELSFSPLRLEPVLFIF